MKKSLRRYQTYFILYQARMLAIAYHNLGSEEDYCKNLEGAVQSYFKAFRLYEENFGPDDPIIEKFKNSYEEARQVICSILINI